MEEDSEDSVYSEEDGQPEQDAAAQPEVEDEAEPEVQDSADLALAE